MYSLGKWRRSAHNTGAVADFLNVGEGKALSWCPASLYNFPETENYGN